MAISDDVKLYCYNQALRILKSRKLSSLTESRESRRELDGVWGSADEGVITCLEHADWNFATRSSKLEHDPGMETSFGFTYVFQKPDDVARLTALSGDERFSLSLTSRQYSDEGGYWLSDTTPLYVRYVSSHTDYGRNSGLWTEAFKQYVGGYLADEACARITGSNTLRREARFVMTDKMKHAKSRDAMDEGTKYPPAGNWVRSRGTTNNRDKYGPFTA